MDGLLSVRGAGCAASSTALTARASAPSVTHSSGGAPAA